MKINTNTTQVFFCSDPHYNHKSLVRGTSNWEDKSPCRDFTTLEEHDDTLVANINKTVPVNGVLFCLGDWSFGPLAGEKETRIREFRSRIKCRTVYLIEGNHDEAISKNLNNVQKIFSGVFKYLEVTFVNPYIGLEQGIKAKKHKVIMMHYPIRSWNHIRSGAWMLYGHCHSSLKDMIVNGKVQKTMDVGFDTHPEFRPYSYQEIKEIMSKREIFTEDHH
jgi:calcineurin-like phosphoesterase family protein